MCFPLFDSKRVYNNRAVKSAPDLDSGGPGTQAWW